MAHPKITKRRSGKLWHLEDSKLPVSSARALVTHLRKTEGKKATFNKTKDGFQVWWSRK
jgi:hypothetical protein